MEMADEYSGPKYGRSLNGAGFLRISRSARNMNTFSKERKIGTWNVKSMYGPGKIHNTIKEMKRLNIRILGISKMRWPGSGKVTVNDHIVYYSGEDSSKHKNSVAIILSKETDKAVKNVVLFSDRIPTDDINTINNNQCEHIIRGEHTADDLDLEDGKIKKCGQCIYLGVKLTKTGRTDEAIKDRITKGKRVIGALNSVLWQYYGRRLETEKRMYNTILKPVIVYGSEVWPLSQKLKGDLLAAEMGFWRRATGKSRLEHMRNEDIRNQMNVHR
ncbi:uncharacterized protein [Diabrotica undecimpunctata]|uniref:uncharacterized protein n=1 Tax=Diabrotica undecimpunctata TaxID=50387 RepID=UPI003B63D218